MSEVMNGEEGDDEDNEEMNGEEGDDEDNEEMNEVFVNETFCDTKSFHRYKPFLFHHY
jgi:hypothetical protein